MFYVLWLSASILNPLLLGPIIAVIVEKILSLDIFTLDFLRFDGMIPSVVPKLTVLSTRTEGVTVTVFFIIMPAQVARKFEGLFVSDSLESQEMMIVAFMTM